jgi:hypothetical protein
MRTIQPTPHRTLWTITLVLPHTARVAVVDGSATRTEAIRQALRGVAVGPQDCVIATHSVVH